MAGSAKRPGLTAAEVEALRAAHGPNALPRPRPPSPAVQLVAQMVHFFALMLWVAAVLAWVGGMPQLAAAIVVVILVNGVFAFLQEYRAERAAARLLDLLPTRATVRRDGHRRVVDAADLVPGDLVILAAGDRVSADMDVVLLRSLRIDASTLTGESVPETPAVGGKAYAGTYVVEGEGEAVVTATGSATRLADIARLTRATRRPPTPLARELKRVVRAMSVTAIGVGVAFFGVGILVGLAARDGFLLAVGVTVALVPEGLLPTITLSLAAGAQRMAGRNALVRRLESVETLGSVTFLCTDKTGTLTRNEMAVVRVWTPNGEAQVEPEGYAPRGRISYASGGGRVETAVRRAAWVARICADGRVEERRDPATGRDSWTPHGDPMEAALDTFAGTVGWSHSDLTVTVRHRLPFDARRRRMSVVTEDEVLVKGAPSAVLALCRPGPDVDAAAAAAEALADRGLRMLGLAARPATATDASQGSTAAEVERDLELVGLVGLEDPPRATAQHTLTSLRTAGIRVGMITGDGPGTAAAIARDVGLSRPDSPVLLGAELPTDPAELGALLDTDGFVLARVDPETKLRVAKALRGRGHVVAMTGDGVNDGPALMEADIGVAMGRGGTDVARQASDLVLLDDDLATVAAAVSLGRATYANVRRFLTYHLTDNVAELAPFVVWALSGGAIPPALTVLQVLALDIGTDLLPALALGVEPPAPHVMERPPPAWHLLDRALLRRVFGVLGPAEALVEMAAFVTVLLVGGWSLGAEPSAGLLATASGAAFTAVVLGQMANAYACRSERRPAWRVRARNPWLAGAVVAELGALLLFLGVPPISDALGGTWPTPAGLAVASLVVPTLLLADAAHKRLRRRPG